ncbi:MAG: alpha-ketoglutarate-dependent dioxygenase AlkB [Cycloclasticus sp.]|nr:alpha-ketoglutarate-dependent dioxygenase AlkB [Cycloclasticus sp.]
MRLTSENLLPNDGVVEYYNSIFSLSDCHVCLDALVKNIHWQHDEFVMFGKHITTKRKVAWYADKPFLYKYSNATKKALIWPKLLLFLKSVVENNTGEKFNSCLLNLYHDGNEGMAWHSDNEKEIVPQSTICSLSFGAERKFSFKHKRNNSKISLNLGNGSLLLMKQGTQTHWLHSLPKTTLVSSPRVNLTFRTIVDL